MKSIVALVIFLPSILVAQTDNVSWRITKPAWTEEDEVRFGQFVASIGQAVSARKCRKVDACIKSAANPYRDTDPAELKPESDCADFPYYLRSYFAWKNGLPMSLESIVTARPVPGNKGDLRYTTYGNIVLARYDVLSTASVFNDEWLTSHYPSGVQFLNDGLKKITWSAAYRMMGLEDGDLFTDYYPAKISRDGIRPGTVIYDPNGHVTIIWKVGDDGRLYYIDSHPDNTVSAGMFNSKFSRSIPDQGAGFKNFRPLILAGATKDSSGAYVGGKIIGAKNATLPLFGKEQFYGTNPDPKGDWKKGKFVYNGNTVSYYDYVRMKMAKGALKINPITDMKADVTDICDSLKDRVEAVQAGIDAGIQNKDHPERLPENIYGTTGEWENFASPARDARLKMVFMELLYSAKNYIARYKAKDPTIVYKGKSLAKDLLAAYQSGVKACQFSYQNSAGVTVSMDMEELRKRLFLISFDPYHCVELRWGASTPAELASCHDGPDKYRWYRQERWLRYQWERQFEYRMDYSLDELTGPLPGAGIAEPPDVDIEAYLNSEIKK